MTFIRDWWWEGDDLVVTTTDGKTMKYKEAVITHIDQPAADDDSCVAETWPITLHGIECPEVDWENLK